MAPYIVGRKALSQNVSGRTHVRDKCPCVLASFLALMTLNLHGYHPMGEAPRWIEERGKPPQPANSDIFFFAPEEFARGNSRRLQALARDVSRLAPDLV